MNLFAGQQETRRHINRFVDTAREGEGGTKCKSSTETYALPYVKIDSQWEFSV